MKTFRKGGIHPEENKLASNSPLAYFPIPKEGIIFTSQHLGAPAVPVVAKGDRVKTGQLVARAEGFISANVHSPFSGTVSKIDMVIDAFGFKKQAIFVEIEGDEWDETIDRSEEIKKDIRYTGEEIIQKIKEKGVVGLGGACFPTHIKYMIPEGKKAEVLIINAVECEPYLTSDDRVMLEFGEQVLIGVRILMKALKVEKALIGIESNKGEAIKRLSSLVKNMMGISVVPLKVKYPQGAEKQLIRALTRRSVPSGKLPIDVGCVVNNIGTVLAVYEAVQKNKPLFESVVTLTGKGISEQKNLIVRNGTTFDQILQHFAVELSSGSKLISGGPMMGKAMTNTSAPLAKGTSSLLILEESESERAKATYCIRCASCVQVCPMGLEPYLLSLYAENGKWEECFREKIMDCIECGCCLFICPAQKPLLDSIRLGKTLYRKNTQKR